MGWMFEMLIKHPSRGVWQVVEYMNLELGAVPARVEIVRVFGIHLRQEGTTEGVGGDRGGEESSGN